MAGRGGYQAPANPAAVSGPGALSKRTDGGPSQAPTYIPSDSYGAGQEMASIQSGAPLAKAASAMAPPAPTPNPMASIVPLDAPSARADEPITAGADFGDGPGSEVLPFQAAAPQDTVASAIRAMSDEYDSPWLRSLVARLDSEGR